MSGKGVVEAAVGLGSNLGDRLGYLCAARDRIAALPGTDSIEMSPVYETEPVGVAEAYQSMTYLNAVLLVRTTLDVEEWSRRLHALEDELYRVRTGERNAPRTIDIDLLTYGDVRMDRPDLRLPHPQCLTRRFVCQPLADLRPDYVVPGQSQTVAQILATLPERPWVRRYVQGDGEPAKAAERRRRPSKATGSNRGLSTEP